MLLLSSSKMGEEIQESQKRKLFSFTKHFFKNVFRAQYKLHPDRSTIGDLFLSSTQLNDDSDLESLIDKTVVINSENELEEVKIETLKTQKTPFLAYFFTPFPNLTRKIGNKSKSPFFLYLSALGYAARGKSDECFEVIRDGMEFSKQYGDHSSIFFKIKLAPLLLFEKLFFRNPLMNLYFESQKSDEKSFVSEKSVLESLLLDATKQNSEEAWMKALVILQQKESWQRIGETRNVVRKIENNKFFEQTLFFKEGADRKQLEREKETIQFLTSKLKFAELPQILYLSEKPLNERYVLVMKFCSGETLTDYLNNPFQLLKKRNSWPERLNCDVVVERVLLSLAELHSKISKDLPKLSIVENLESKLKNKNLDLPLKIAQGILDNYSLVADLINSVDYWVYNKDAHPENWIISDKVTAIDFEATHLVPFTFDLANLLDYETFFDDKKIKEYISHYITKSKEVGVEINSENLWPRYKSSLIHRLFCLVSAWSDPGRQKYAARREDALDRIILNIWQLKRGFSSSESKGSLERLTGYVKNFKEFLKKPYTS